MVRASIERAEKTATSELDGLSCCSCLYRSFVDLGQGSSEGSPSAPNQAVRGGQALGHLCGRWWSRLRILPAINKLPLSRSMR
jgi:hypothetical protein